MAIAVLAGHGGGPVTTMAPGRAPGNDPELIRSLHERIRRLEQKREQRIGPWVLSSQDGSLIATKPGESMELGAAATVVDLGALPNYINVHSATPDSQQAAVAAWFGEIPMSGKSPVQNLVRTF